MRIPSPLPETLDALAAFSVADARALEVGMTRLRRGDLVSPHHGVRAKQKARTFEERVAAYLPRLRPGQVFAQATAAGLLGIPVPRALRDGPLHVAAVYPQQCQRVPGVVGHRLLDRPGVLEQTVGYPVTGALETWCGLGAVLGVKQLVMAGDHLVHKGVAHPQEVLAELDRTMRAVRRTGIRRLERAFSLIRPGVRSAMESLVRVEIVLADLPEPVVNLRLYRPDGRFLGEGDLVHPEQRQVLEYEGDGHRTDDGRWAKDLDRREDFEDEGWSVMRITKVDVVQEKRKMLRRIARRLGLG